MTPLKKRLEAFNRVRLIHRPTPLERAARLGDAIGLPNLWIKRDDCTGFALGGNKGRKLEFLIGEALAAGADTLITTGGYQSNHVRQSVAAARRFGLHPVVLLSPLSPHTDGQIRSNGNILLDRLFGAQIEYLESEKSPIEAMYEFADVLTRQGRRPYIAPFGGSSAAGALGYLDGFAELAEQLAHEGLRPAKIVHASSSGGTQSGLIAGAVLLDLSTEIVGVNVYKPDATDLRVAVKGLLKDLAPRLSLDESEAISRIRIEQGGFGEGYGVLTGALIREIQRAARTEALVFDPVYSGKALHWLACAVRDGVITSDEVIVLLHTGGAPSVFAYPAIAEDYKQESH
jgi:L-cysteate sulfo-lyase